MLKFIRGKGHHQSADRQKLQKELFAYTKTAQHGFPHKPSAMAYDPKTKLLAIGTQTGSLKIYGRPGVEYYGQHPPSGPSISDCCIQILEWVSGTGRILSLGSGNQVILWEPCGSSLNRLYTLRFDGKLKKVSCLFCSLSKDIIWIGTENGNMYQLDLTLTNQKIIISHELIVEEIPDSYRLNPGAIECIKQLPNAWDKLLIAYNRGLCVLWDLRDNRVIKTFISSGHGQSIGLYLSPNGTDFTWFHGDGSYATWHLDNINLPEEQDYVPYGPDPCKSITNLVKGFRNKDEIVIFSGGMPRSTYGDRHCVSVHCHTGEKICLDFTSKVINFTVVFSDPDPNQCEILIVLLEEEICAFDLVDPKLLPIKIPYLSSIHASAITCNNLISGVTREVYELIEKTGIFNDTSFSKREWPITGGILIENTKTNDTFDVYITGHEDGSVKFWDCTDIVLKPLYHLKTARYFGHDDVYPTSESVDPSNEEEPPFRRAGQFDPFSDDPRLAIKKVILCPSSGHLAIAGTAGQIFIFSFRRISANEPFKFTIVNLVSDRDGFLWKGHDELKIRPNLFDAIIDPVDASVQILEIIQVLPPAAITCLAFQTDYCLLAAGTAHGFVLYNYRSQTTVLTQCTLKPNDVTGASEQLSRRKSFKRTLRESFRRLRRSRSSRFTQTRKNVVEPRPIERQIEARPVDDAFSSMVRCLVFVKTFITNVNSTVPTFWVATNSSSISIFILHINNSENKFFITAQLAKEIQLKHRAPVVSILLFDQLGTPLDFHSPVAGFHRVLIASEEQFKVFSLPHLKPINKYKLTAHEGARVRRLAVANFFCHLPQGMSFFSPNKSHFPNVDTIPAAINGCNVQFHNEYGLLCLTNLGDCLVLSIPELKRQLNVAAVRREDINGISSLCFTTSGEALFMMSSSELQRISISKTKIVVPTGVIDVEPLEEKLRNTLINYEVDHKISSPNEEETVKSVKSLNTEKNDLNNCTNTPNGDSSSLVNETIHSNIEDITIDSVKDHLNSTVTTLCSSTTEETISCISISNLQTKKSEISATIKNPELANFSDLSPLGKKNESHSESIIIENFVATISNSTPSKENQPVKLSKGHESSF